MHLIGDLRYGVRLLLKSPGFAATSLVTLALGIGATTAIFSVVDAVVMKPLPFRDPGQVAIIWEKNPSQNRFRLRVAAINMVEWQRQARSVRDISGIFDTTLNLTGGPNGRVDPEELKVERVSVTLFPMLGVQAAQGRTFTPDEDHPGGGIAALLSDAFWRRKFGSDPAVVGKTIRLRSTAYQIAGVLPPGFRILDPAVDVYLPLGYDPNDPRMGAARVLTVLARLAPGATLEQARQEMAVIGERLEAANPALNRGWAPSVFTIQDELYGKAERAMWVLLGAVGMLLMMACVNVANLLLARGAGRQKEVAIRGALGGMRGDLIRQFLAESLLLSLLGGLFGIGLARLGIALVVTAGPASIPRLSETKLDAPLLLFAVAISILSGLFFGIVPALQGSHGNLRAVLAESSRGGASGRSANLWRSALAVAEIVLAVVLCIGAGLLLRSFDRLRGTSLGFRPEHVLTLRLPMASGRTDAAPRRAAFLDQMLQKLAALPGAQFAGACSTLPLDDLGAGTGYAAEDQGGAGQKPTALLRAATPSYFQAIGIPLLAGRYFTAQDTRAVSPLAIVDALLVRRLFPDGKAVGKKVWTDANERASEIVGVVGTVKPLRLDDIDWPTIYMPYAQRPDRTMMAAIRTAGDPGALAASVRGVAHDMDPDLPIAAVRPMTEVVGESMADSRFNALALGFFGLVAFLLAAIGIYGVISCDVAARTNEIGIRMALGAGRGQIVALILRQGAKLAGIGIALGLLARLRPHAVYAVDAVRSGSARFLHFRGDRSGLSRSRHFRGLSALAARHGARPGDRAPA